MGSGLVDPLAVSAPAPRVPRKRTALRLIGVSFFALAAYVMVESVRALADGSQASTSTVGIALAAASLAVMRLLSWAQRRTGRALGSGSVVADSKQSLLCTFLSAVLLGGLVINAGLGRSWADPLVGLVVAGSRPGRASRHGAGRRATAMPRRRLLPVRGCLAVRHTTRRKLHEWRSWAQPHHPSGERRTGTRVAAAVGVVFGITTTALLAEVIGAAVSG